MSCGGVGGHVAALSLDAEARGGAVARCLAGPCDWREEGTEATVTARALDHFDETSGHARR